MGGVVEEEEEDEEAEEGGGRPRESTPSAMCQARFDKKGEREGAQSYRQSVPLSVDQPANREKKRERQHFHSIASAGQWSSFLMTYFCAKHVKQAKRMRARMD